MEKKIDNIENKNNDVFLEILKQEDDLNSLSDQKILFVTTDSWIAQLGSRINN